MNQISRGTKWQNSQTFSATSTWCRSVTDRQTDRQTYVQNCYNKDKTLEWQNMVKANWRDNIWHVQNDTYMSFIERTGCQDRMLTWIWSLKYTILTGCMSQKTMIRGNCSKCSHKKIGINQYSSISNFPITLCHHLHFTDWICKH